MTSHVEQIKQRLSIVDVVSGYLKLEKSGANYKACCPFHNEKTPSFFISPERNSYYCFGCGVKGDMFSFVEQFEGLDFKGALAVLADKAQVQLTPFNKEETTKKDRLYLLMQEAVRWYQNNLTSEVKTYLLGRGVTDTSIDAFQIGYAKDGWRDLVSAMRSKGFMDEELVLVGLAKHPDDNPKGEIYDRFRDRIMFPIMDTGGRPIAFSGRLLHEKEGQGKYINSPETPLFKKGATLYGLDKAKFAIRKQDLAILVEGQMDLVLSHQAGFTNTVASSGTALSDSLVADGEKGLLSGLGQVHGLTQNLVIAFDADKAGMKAAARAERIGLTIGMHVKIAKLPKGQDPADVIREDPKKWKDIITEATHIVLFYLAVLREHNLSEHTQMRAVRDRILPYIALIPSAVERAFYIKKVSEAVGIPLDALTEDVDRIITREPVPEKKEEGRLQAVRVVRIQNRLLGLLLWQEEKTEKDIDPVLLKERLSGIVGMETFQSLYDTAVKRKNEYIFEVEALYAHIKKLDHEVEELLFNLEEEILTGKLETLVQSIEKINDEGELKERLKTLQDITKRLNTIKSSRF